MNHYKIEYKNRRKYFVASSEFDAKCTDDAIFLARCKALSNGYKQAHKFDIYMQDDIGNYHKIISGVKV